MKNKYCPKGCVIPLDGTNWIDKPREIVMDRRTIQPAFCLTDGMGFSLLWTEDNLPVLYRCPECGYTEMYIGEPKDDDG